MSAIPVHHPSHPNHEALRRSLVKKIDWHVLPGLSLLWLACFIDRTNIGNVKVAGMDVSLGLVNNQYNIALAVFYITYILSELPSNYVLKKVGGKVWLPFLVASWGTVTIFAGFMQNFASLIAVRLLLGLFEGGLLPGMVIYLSTMYKRNELQLRVGIFFASASLSGAFGGLLAYMIEKMDGIGGKKGWRWVFYLEGIGTLLVALFALYYLPSSLSKASFLTPEEKEFGVERMKHGNAINVASKVVLTNGELPHESSFYSKDEALAAGESKDSGAPELQKLNPDDSACPEEKFEMYEVIRAFKEPQVWITGLGYLSVCVGLYSYSLFLPTIVSGMGYKGSSAQLFSSFPYLPASVLVVFVAFFADKLQLRAPVVVALLPLTMLGYVLAIVANSAGMRYAGVFLMAAGIYPSIPSILCILPNNTAGATKKSACTAAQLMIANCGGFIATFIYTADQAPNYIRGHSIALSFTCLAWCMMLLNSLYCLRENRLRASGRREKNINKYKKLIESGKTAAPIGDRDPTFKMTI